MPSVALIARPADEPSGHPVVPRFLHLLEADWDAHLVLLGRGSRSVERQLPNDAHARVHVANPGSAARNGRAPRMLSRPRRPADDGLHGLLRRLDANLVHLASIDVADEWLGQADGLPARIVVGMVGDDVHGAVLAEPERYRSLWRRIDAFHVESESLAEVARRLGAPPHSVVVVPPVVAAPLGARVARDDGWLRILGIGPLSWTHGYEYALDAVRLLREAGVACRYRIVGRGDYEDAVAFARYQLGLEDVVEIVAPRGRDALTEHLAWADVLLNAAVVPTSPTAVLAAQAAGVAVVTTEPPITGEETALIAGRRDSKALAHRLATLANDADCRGRVAKAGLQAATAAPDVDSQVGRFLDLYRTVLERA